MNRKLNDNKKKNRIKIWQLAEAFADCSYESSKTIFNEESPTESSLGLFKILDFNRCILSFVCLIVVGFCCCFLV